MMQSKDYHVLCLVPPYYLYLLFIFLLNLKETHMPEHVFSIKSPAAFKPQSGFQNRL